MIANQSVFIHAHTFTYNILTHSDTHIHIYIHRERERHMCHELKRVQGREYGRIWMEKGGRCDYIKI